VKGRDGYEALATGAWNPPSQSLITIRVPASTSNLGSGFDALGLALQLYLTVHLDWTEQPYGSFVFEGEGAEALREVSEDNLIFRAMRYAAAAEGVELKPARILVQNDIPLARGLGSSGAAIIAGISVFELVSGTLLPPDKMLAYATQIEGHSDNISAALLGSFVVSCVTAEAGILAQRLEWPERIQAIVVIPNLKVRTEEARGVLPDQVSYRDAVFNIQRASLMVASVATGRLDLIREAMRDRLHQPYRAKLVPGLDRIIEMDSQELAGLPGYLGIALSGSGPTVIALATGDFDHIASAIKDRFQDNGVESRHLLLPIDGVGRIIEEFEEDGEAEEDEEFGEDE
jgi:homoserine kinase